MMPLLTLRMKHDDPSDKSTPKTCESSTRPLSIVRRPQLYAKWLIFLVLMFNQMVSGFCALPLLAGQTSGKLAPPRSSICLAKDTRATDESRQSTKKRPKNDGASSRSTAIFALHESSRRPSTIALRILENDPAYQSLEPRDRAYARLLLTTAERRHGQIDNVLQKLMHKSKTKKKSSDFLCDAAMRIGATQMLFLETPAYAAVKETVEVLRMHPKISVAEAQIKFVNAILRRLDKEGKHLVELTSTLDNVAPALAAQWIESYGEESTRKIVDASMSQSPIFITVNERPDSTDKERLLQRERIREALSLSSLREEAELLAHGSIRVPEQQSSIVSEWPGYDEGEWWVQDPSASLPALALWNAMKTGKKLKDLHVVDLCSAPGGKTAQLCSLGFGRVTAVELSSKRTKPLRENLERLGMMERCDVVVMDGREWTPGPGDNVDAVLLDAPCSATGVGSRRPDVLQKSPDQLEQMTELQRELAAHVVDNILPPGGVMVYATCSLLKSESEDQIHWLMSREKGREIETIPFQPGELPGFDDAIDENGWLRVIPGHLPGSLSFGDGFFIARIRRI